MGGCVIWTSQPNRGQSAAANRAFAQSKGDILGWLNSDDAYFGPTVIADVVDLFSRRPDVDVVYGHAVLVNSDGLVLHMMWAPPFSDWLLKHQSFIIQSTTFIRRSALRGHFLDESYDYAMDRELWLRLARRCKFVRLPKVLAIDRHHLSRKSQTMRPVGRVENERLIERYGASPNNGGPAFKTWHIALRILGVSLIPEARKGPFAFSATRDRMVKLLLRQLAMRKSSMPTGI
jgi:glycosyltransferase involved in cell wall biosynthesis